MHVEDNKIQLTCYWNSNLFHRCIGLYLHSHVSQEIGVWGTVSHLLSITLLNIRHLFMELHRLDIFNFIDED